MLNPIPKSLDVNFLRDAIVELRFQPTVATNLLPGILYERLRSQWTAPRPELHTIALNFQLSATATPEPIFTRGDFELHVRETSVYFNVKQNYEGWKSSYRPLLKETLPLLLEGGILQPTRISLRFVNDIPHPDVYELMGKFTDAVPDGWRSRGKAMRMTMQKDDITAVINFASQIATANKKETISVIDIDLQRVIQAHGDNDTDNLLQLIDELHALDKELLFGRFLPPAFLEAFNPVYD